MTKLVTIGCKLPNGIIIVLGDKKAKINGFNQNMVQVADGFGITENVDEELFDAWLAKHANFALVKNGLIFKSKNANEATAKGKDLKGKKGGLEQLDPAAEGVKPVEEK